MKEILESVPEFHELQETYSTHINLTKMCMSIFDSFKLSKIANLEQSLVLKTTSDGDQIDDNVISELVEILSDQELE
ncbi:Protein transport protein sec1 [Smittium culicis]|uniref:Protein transport protein sec1 n=1 Tax=Smittium culicis TaxID=133412 RepID=A0A1R1Y1C5_9FUNG|nr:Protein transport protein sec1 [Smittium culicis]